MYKLLVEGVNLRLRCGIPALEVSMDDNLSNSSTPNGALGKTGPLLFSLPYAGASRPTNDTQTRDLGSSDGVAPSSPHVPPTSDRSLSTQRGDMMVPPSEMVAENGSPPKEEGNGSTATREIENVTPAPARRAVRADRQWGYQRQSRAQSPRPPETYRTRLIDPLADPSGSVSPVSRFFIDPPSQSADEIEAELMRKAATKEKLDQVETDIENLYTEVSTQLARSAEHATQALSWLNEAHRIVLVKPERFLDAKLRVQQTRMLLSKFQHSQDSYQTYLLRIVGWNMLWLIIYGLLFVFDGLIVSTLVGELLPQPAEVDSTIGVTSFTWYFQPWLCALAGGIGGCLTALIVFRREVSQRTFDAASTVDYFLNGIIGLVLGCFTYYTLLGGFISAAALSSIGTGASTLAQRVEAAGSPLFLLVAFIAGLAQPRVLALLSQVWDQVTGDEAAPNQATEGVLDGTESKDGVPGTVAVGQDLAFPPVAEPYANNDFPVEQSPYADAGGYPASEPYQGSNGYAGPDSSYQGPDPSYQGPDGGEVYANQAAPSGASRPNEGYTPFVGVEPPA